MMMNVMKESMNNRPWKLTVLVWALSLLLLVSMVTADSQHLLNTSSYKQNSEASVMFSLNGRVYPEGYLYAIMYIGNPPNPFYLDIDTGSDLTWVQCDGPCRRCIKAPHDPYRPTKSSTIVSCKDPFCEPIPPPKGPPPFECDDPKTPCKYEIKYADHGSSMGEMLTDFVLLQFTNGTSLGQRLTFGCGYDQVFPESTHAPLIDGVLGLGNGGSSFLSQMRGLGVTRNVIGHCINSKGGGYLYVGDNPLPPNMVWVPLLPSSVGKYYYIGPGELQFDGKAVLNKGLSYVFDSGSTYTYLNKEAYTSMINLIKKNVDSKFLQDAPEEDALPICWKGAKRFSSINDVRSLFKPLGIRFSGNSLLDVLPDHYLIITEKGNVCLGILNGSEAQLGDINLIGDVSMQDRLMVYDNEKRQIGWKSVICDKPPKF